MARSISKTEFEKLRQKVNVLIVTAMPVEEEAVNAVLAVEPLIDEIIPLYQQFRFGYFGKYLAAHLRCGQAGLRTAAEVTAALAELRGGDNSHSFYVLMPGIACGLKRNAIDKTTIACSELEKYFSKANNSKLPQVVAVQLRASLKTEATHIVLPNYMTPETSDTASTQQIGDMLIASDLWQHNFRATKADRVEDRGSRFEASHNRLNLLLEHAKVWRQTASEADYGSRRCQVHCGPVISGDELLNHYNRREVLRAEYPNAIGLDMEGHGLGTSVLSYTNKEREGQAWFLFAKGICDWGVGKSDGWQERAAAASVSLLRHCFDDPNFSPDLIRPADKKAVASIFSPEAAPPDGTDASSESAPFNVHPPALKDCLQACQQQVQRSLPVDWVATSYVPRSDIANAFEEFRNSDQPLFVLVGDSGCGKSWECAAEAAERLKAFARLLIPGSWLTQGHSLVDLIYRSLSDVAHPDATAEGLFRQLNDYAVGSLNKSLVLIVDDVLLPNDTSNFEVGLQTLCREARQRNIKLVLSVRSGIWERISQGKRLAPHVFRRIVLPHKPLQHSFEITRLTDDELCAMLVRLLPTSSQVNRLFPALRQPVFAVLRNPYLLKIYLKQHFVDGQGSTPVPVDVDSLLDAEAENRFNIVKCDINCEPDEIADVVKTLIAEMWQTRRTGKPSGALIRNLDVDIAECGRRILHLLQSEDVLTRSADIKAPEGAVVYANPQLGDRLTALWLTSRIQQGEDVFAEMEPGLDDGVMTALVRQAIDKAETDAIAWTESVLKRDVRWLRALAQGLAQRHEEDWRIPALLTAWSNRDEPYSAWNTLRSLGSMAGHSSYARAWIAALYADEALGQAYKGEIALGAALNIVPSWVKRRMLLRLRRELQRPAGFTMINENKDQARYLRGALEPLQTTSHIEAAATARSLLTWFQGRYVPPRDPEHMDVRETLGSIVNAIRGRVALFGSEADIAEIVQELGSQEFLTRQAAARALLPIAEGRPHLIKAAVFRQASVEQSVLGDVPRLLYFYTESDPDSVIASVQSGNMLHTRACGIALTLLAHIARTHPQKVGRLLPSDLHEFPSYARGLLNELLAFAWWQYASQVPNDVHAKSVLIKLSIPDYDDVEDKHRAFITYSASVAVLTRIGLSIEGMSVAAAESPVVFHHLALEININFLYVQIQETCGRFADRIAAHPLFVEWCDLLCQTAKEYETHEIYPIDTASEWQFRVTNLATDWLCACAPYIKNPQTIVAALPPDWPFLRFCTALVRANRITTEIVEQACQLCVGNINVEGNISGDRDRFLYALREAGQLPPAYAGLLANRSMWAEARLSSLEANIRHEPEAILETLHVNVVQENAVAVLWEWGGDTTDWRSILLSHVLRSMFLPSVLSLQDCKCFCDQVLTAIRDLPASNLVDEYQAAYTTLRAFCDTDKVEVPAVEFGNSLLSHSHRMAMEVVRSFQNTPQPLDDTWFEQLIYRKQGWVHDNRHWLKNGAVVSGYGGTNRTLYFPPALRVAFALASVHSNRADFVSAWTREQSSVQELLSSGSCKKVAKRWYEHLHQEEKEELLTSALREINSQIAITPRNAPLHVTKGSILLLLDKVDQAHEVLQTCLTLSWYDPQVFSSAHYDLACCYARKGEAEQCRIELQLALPGLPHMGKKHVENDSDFAAIRHEQWFVELVAGLPDFLYIR